MQDVEPVTLVDPESHVVQSVEPVLSWYVPALHCVQEAEPTVSAYEPAAHGVQLAAAELLYLPSSQLTQTPVPAYLPAPH